MADKQLTDAAHVGDLQKMEKILNSREWHVNDADRYGFTAIQTAVRNNQLEATDYLLSLGANPNVADKNGFTPLHEAALNGNLDIVTLLIMHGANRDCYNSEGMTPLDISVRYAYGAIVQILCRGHDAERGFY